VDLVSNATPPRRGFLFLAMRYDDRKTTSFWTATRDDLAKGSASPFFFCGGFLFSADAL